jgi:uncharacterized membrane protein YhaH (DUF805 family)
MTTQDAFKKLDLALGLGKDRVELKFNQLKKELDEKIRNTSNEKLKNIFVSRLNEVETAYAVLLDYFEPNKNKLREKEEPVVNLNSNQRNYFFVNGQDREGPFSLSELKAKDIKWNTLIWYQGLNEWKEACEIEELSGVFESVPPPIKNQTEPLNDFTPVHENIVPPTQIFNSDSFADTQDNAAPVYSKSDSQSMFSNLFSFDGRIRRTEYGFTLIIYAVLWFIIGFIAASKSSFSIIGLAYIPLVWMLWAQGAKRCHDLGKNGWWQIIPFYVFWLIFQDGEAEVNQYGDNPKE